MSYIFTWFLFQVSAARDDNGGKRKKTASKIRSNRTANILKKQKTASVCGFFRREKDVN